MSDRSVSVDTPITADTSGSRNACSDSTALGVVHGDIGTTRVYAMRECFFGSHPVPPTHENVLGALSLIIYALVLVISVTRRHRDARG